MKRKSKAMGFLITGVALAVGIAISSGIIRNSYVADEAKAAASTITLNNIGENAVSSVSSTIMTTSVNGYELNYLQGRKITNSTSSAIFLTKSTNPAAFISNKSTIPGSINSVKVTILSGASDKTTYYCRFGTSEFLTAGSGGSAVNIAGGNSYTYTNSVPNATYFSVSLGNANNGQVLSFEINYEATPPRTLTDIEVTGEPTTKVYNSGESFNPAGITVTASFSDSPNADVTSLCQYSPDPLIQGTTFVSVSYTEGAITKSSQITGLSVNAAPESKIVQFGSDGDAEDWETAQQNTGSDYIGIATSSHYAKVTADSLFGANFMLGSNLNIKFKIGSYGGNGPQGTIKVALFDSDDLELSSVSGLTQLNNSTESYTQGPGGTDGIDVLLPQYPGMVSYLKIFLSDVGGFTTSIYMRLQEITLTYTLSLRSVEVDEDAVVWGTDFLSATAAGCSALDQSQLLTAWSGLETSFNALSSEAKNYLTSLTPNVAGNDAQHAVARYIYIISKYGDTTFADFMNLDIQAAPSVFDLLDDGYNYVPLIAVIGVVGLTVIIGYYYLKKRQEA